jgi:hypothetical protein
VERTEKSEFILTNPPDPADALHLIKQGVDMTHVEHFHVSQQCSIAIHGQMRQSRYQEDLVENEFLDGSSLISGVINNDVRKHSDAWQCVWHSFRVIRFEVEELAR